MKHSPINIFQKLMRKWDAVHPYNAAQIMKLSGKPDVEVIQMAWNDALTATGLGSLSIEENRYTFLAPESSSRASVDYPAASLTDHVSLELNRYFGGHAESPFRPFVIPEGNHYFAGVIYQHWIADSASIRMLLHEWFLRMFDPNKSRGHPLQLPRGGYWEVIGPHRGGWEVLESALSMGRRHTRLRKAMKIGSAELSDHSTAFEMFSAPSGIISQLKHFSVRRRVKLNDIFLAALMEACAKHVPLQRRPSRTDIAVGSIVDLRPFCRNDLDNIFGLFLGFTNVVCRPDDLVDFDRVLQAVSNQTRLQKSTGVAQASLMWMAAAVGIGTLSRPDELYHFYRKELPLAGGISNVDLTKTWSGKYFPSPLLDYIRVSPSGPMTPIVLTTTTIGQNFTIGVTYRIGLIGKERAGRVVEQFIGRLISLANKS